MFPLFRGRTRIAGLVGAVALLLALSPSLLRAGENSDCLDCHGDADILSWSAEELASNVVPGGPVQPHRVAAPFPGISLHVDSGLYEASVHADLSCTDCHEDVKELPHAAHLKPVECSGCHTEEAAVYAKSRHVVGYNKMAVGMEAPRCSDCHGALAISKTTVSTSPVYFRNIAATCTRCHGNREVIEQGGIAIPGAARMYEKSIHNIAIVEKGLNKSASCVDCHGAHDLKDRFDPQSPIYRANIPETCGKCHYGVFTIFRESVHGVAFFRGVPDAPGCTDCHGEHEIRQASDPRSSVSFMVVSEKTCPSCHAAEKLASRYGVETNKVKGYRDSFHGLSQRLGDRTVANCSSCHGVHEIFSTADPRSTVNPQNLPVTCGQCHPNAGVNFAKGNIHAGPGGVGGSIKSWVRSIYIWLIVIVIGGMVLHNGADYIRKMQALYRERTDKWSDPGYERLNRSERIQHFLTLLSFFVLVITGFALKFKWSIPFLADATNVSLRGNGHRAAAIVMVGTSLYHVFYAVFTARGRDQLAHMMPRWQDALDVVAMLKYYAGLSDHRPKFGRYGYVEKAEYLALVWGTIVMVVTGFMLWFENETLKLIPMWGLDVATLVHYYEAILATLAIFVWHLYYVIVNPDFAPMSFTWIDGKLSRHHMEHEHPLELEEIAERERRGEAVPGPATRPTEEK
jgi:cytochrome b subunit of formate dehydrogenase